MPTTSSRGTDIFYDTTGTGPALLMSHGFLMDHTMFDHQVTAFARDYQCVRWDERGFGQTRTNGPFDYWQSAADGVAVLDACGVESAVWIGMSQGGFLSLRAALASPDRVRALVLIDSAADVDDAPTIAGYRGMLDVMEHGSEDERAAVFEVVAGLILGNEQLAGEWIPMWEDLDRDQLTLAGGALIDRDDISDRLSEIACPVLVIHGLNDQAITLDRAQAVCAGVRDCRGLVEIEGAAHAPNMTQPAAVNDAIAEFLASLT